MILLANNPRQRPPFHCLAALLLGVLAAGRCRPRIR